MGPSDEKRKTEREETKEEASPKTASSRLGVLTLVTAALVALVALGAYRRDSADDAVRARMAAVLRSLLKQETQIAPVRRPRVAVGYGACKDLFVRATDVFDARDAPEVPEHFLHVQDEEQLHKMFAYFFQHGAAAE